MRITVRGILLGLRGRVAKQLKDFLHMLQIVFASFLRFGVVFHVVVAVGKSQTALREGRPAWNRSCPGPVRGRN